MVNKEELQKHIQLLNEIKTRYPILYDTIKYLEEYQQTLSNPTLDECIKEWEDKGFKTNIYQDILYIKSWKLKCEIRIWISDLTYVCSKWHKPFYYTMDMELHNLLTKTLKALEVKDG